MKINLGTGVQLDLDKAIESRMLVQANSGGGKSYTLRRFIEQSFGKKQIIILDPEGEFGNMRSGYDFVYIAKEGGDAVASPRTAALLARKLLETKANAIIDIYELGSERHAFVKNFMEALVNMPKELWTDCFIILDEAHKFAPEKGQGESIALTSVIDMASLGRKRGYCLIPATQRPSKLSKDVVAECNNKLIGRASLDIDRKRSAEELGFNTKEEVLSLRNLEPGEFYAFGPALSHEVVKTQIGAVSIPPPKRGTGRSIKIAPPSAKVKSILAGLKDIPEEAEKEARTIAEFKTEIRNLKAQLKAGPPVRTETKIEKVKEPPTERELLVMLEPYRKQLQEELEKSAGNALEEWKSYAFSLLQILHDGQMAVKGLKQPAGGPIRLKTKLVAPKQKMVPIVAARPAHTPAPLVVTDTSAASKGELLILKAAASLDEGMTRQHLTVQTGYKRSTRDKYVQLLTGRGFVELASDRVKATEAGIAALGNDYQTMPTDPAELANHHLSTLPGGEAAVLRVLLDAGRPLSRDEITEATNYQRSTRDKYIQLLATRQLVVVGAGTVEASPFLIP